MIVEQRKLSELIAYDRNPRTNDAAVDHVLESIKQHQQVKPIVISAKGKPFSNEVICCGHTTAKAMKIYYGDEDGMVNVIVHPFDTEKDFVDYNIRDNKTGEWAQWDMGLITELGAEYQIDLNEMGFQIEPQNTEGKTGDDEIPEDVETICKTGQLWILGDHRLLCGDSTDQEQVIKLMNGGKADLLMTDPPYNVNYEGKSKDRLTICNDNMRPQEFGIFLFKAFSVAQAVLKRGAVFYIWHPDSDALNFRSASTKAGLITRQCLIWKKNCMVMGRQDYHWQHEPCLYGWTEGAGHRWYSDRKQTTILDFNKPLRSDQHPTMKPVDLYIYLICNNTKGDDLVLDTFLGSGTTIIACEKTNRKCYGMEIDPHYCDVIIKRWEDYTGRKAELES